MPNYPTMNSISEFETQELEALALEQEKRRRKKARNNLADFIRYTFPEYEFNWHHYEICEAVMAWYRGEFPNLAIQCPPAHGKSEIISRRLPAFLLGLNPNAMIMAASHTAMLANQMNRDIQRIIDDDRYAAVFPKTTLWGKNIRTVADGSWLRNSDEFEVVGHKGRYKCAGVGGPLIGSHFDYGIIDDPFKDAAEAYSETVRASIWEWYSSVFANRRKKGNAKQLIIMHRWHEDDLLGRILTKKAAPWKVLNFEALATQDRPKQPKDTALWPGRFPVSFLEEQRATNPHSFSALYQGTPIPMGGGMFKRSWFRYAEKNGSPDLLKLGEKGWLNIRNGRRYVTVDLAASTKTTGDYTVIACWSSMKDGTLVLLDLVRERLEGPDIIPAITRALERTGGEAWIETIGFQATLLQTARRLGMPCRELRPDKDKVTRAAPMAAHFSAGQLWFAPGAWHIDMERELLSFPAGAHDDIVDAMAYGVIVHNKGLAQAAVQLR